MQESTTVLPAQCSERPAVAAGGRFFRTAGALLAALVALSGLFAGIVGRQRPNYWIMHDPADIGYPSGHEMNAVVISALLLVAFMPRIRSGWRRAALIAGCLLFIVATFLTRIYVQAHFASDMIAG